MTSEQKESPDCGGACESRIRKHDYSLSFKEINASALSAGLPAQWYPKAKRYGQSLRIGNLAGDPGSSLWIDLRSGAWKDHASGDSGGDLISLYAAREGIGQNEARQKNFRVLVFGLSFPCTGKNRLPFSKA